MARIYVDGRPFNVDPKQNLLHVCLSLGFDLPYFCWHPAMGSVGACRQCAVKQFKDEQDAGGKLIMACMTPAADGTRISIKDPEAAAFRSSIIQGMMENHPHDCPVCDEGGECHLQDMTYMTGHDYRAYRFGKRTFRNQYLGPFVNHEMNRCIQCYRCVRFYREYAGGRDLNAYAMRDNVYFGRHEDGVLESEFSGNLVEVCPTGVFTDATLKRHYTRKWDLQMAPSICVHCGLGCNTSPGERYGVLRRIYNRYHGEVNGWFLCDRGRYGYEFVNSERRIRKPRVRLNGGHEAVGEDTALRRMHAILSGNRRIIGIGSPRASLESNFALRTLVGAEHFYAGMSDDEYRLVKLMIEILRRGPARIPTLREIEICDAVFVLGEDVSNTSPRMALSLRQSIRQPSMRLAEKLRIPLWLDHAVREAAQDASGPLFLATPAATRLDDIATRKFHAAADDLARLGFAVAHVLDPRAPEVGGLSEDIAALARQIAGALGGAERPLVISGPGCNSDAVIQAAANVARALCAAGRKASLSFTAHECNSIGLSLMGAGELGLAFRALREGSADTVVIVEDDLFRRAPADEVVEFLRSARHLIVMDSILSQTQAYAELVLPAGTFAEADGTLVNNEGRAQRFFQVFPPSPDIRESWRWIGDYMREDGRRESADWRNLDDVLAALAAELPALAHAIAAAPLASSRGRYQKVPREPHRYSGRTAYYANINVSEPRPPLDLDGPLSFSMEGWPAAAPPPLLPFSWAPGWNSNQQSAPKFQSEVNGPLRGGDPGVRLIEPEANAKAPYFNGIPDAFGPRQGEWLMVPLHHIFGSEELSALAPAIAELAVKPYIALNRDDAAELGVVAATEVEVLINGGAARLRVSISSDIPRGVAGVPMGLPGISGAGLSGWGRVKRI